jgi:undecaprenyl-diphosphatase
MESGLCTNIHIWRAIWQKSSHGLLALFLSSAAILTLKYIVAEPKPFLVLSHVHLLTTENDYSFPSGHATASFAGAVAIGKKYSFIIKGKTYKLIYPLLAFATLIGFSMVYVGVHYPLNVIFGGSYWNNICTCSYKI